MLAIVGKSATVSIKFKLSIIMMSGNVGFVSAPAWRVISSRTAVSRSPARWVASVAPAKRLRELSANTRRGSEASPETLSELHELVQSLESKGWQGPGDGPLASEEGMAKLDGQWELVFEVPRKDSDASGSTAATEASVAATDGSEGKRGRVLQNFDVRAKRVDNRAETNWGTFHIESSFCPRGDSPTEVEVEFEKAKIQVGALPEVGIPLSWVGGGGTLDTTYLGDDVRIGRGNKGTLFCLVRPDDAGLE